MVVNMHLPFIICNGSGSSTSIGIFQPLAILHFSPFRFFMSIMLHSSCTANIIDVLDFLSLISLRVAETSYVINTHISKTE